MGYRQDATIHDPLKLRLQDPAKRVALEQVAEFEVFAEHVEAFVPAEAFQVGRMYATLHAVGQRAAFEAMPAKIPRAKSGTSGARLHDRGDRPGGDCRGVDTRQGRGLARLGLAREPNPPEHRTRGDPCGFLPSGERAPGRARSGRRGGALSRRRFAILWSAVA